MACENVTVPLVADKAPYFDEISLARIDRSGPSFCTKRNVGPGAAFAEQWHSLGVLDDGRKCWLEYRFSAEEVAAAESRTDLPWNDHHVAAVQIIDERGGAVFPTLLPPTVVRRPTPSMR